MAKVKIATKKKKQLGSGMGQKDEMSIHHAYLSFTLAQQERGNSPQTIAFYDRCYKRLAAITNDGEMPVSTISSEGFQTIFIESLGAVGRQTVNSYLRGLRAFGNYCKTKDFIETFECAIKETEPPLKQVYTRKELSALLVKPSINNFEQYRNYTIINLLLATGARANTVINLRISDVDLEEGYINFNTTKTHKVVRIGLERKAQRELTEYISYWRTGEDIHADDYLFCNSYGEQLTRSGLSKAIATYNRSRGVSKTSIHLFRHTFAKNWITSGGDIISLASILTHTELKMVKRYANLYSADIKEKIAEHSVLSQLRTSSGKMLKISKKEKQK